VSAATALALSASFPLATHRPPEPSKRRNAAAAPRPGGGLERGRRSGPHHCRRGLHGEQSELHQGPAGAVHLPPPCIPTSTSPDLPQRDDFYSCFSPNCLFNFSRRSGGFLMVAMFACRSSRTCGRSSTPPPSTARSPTSTASRSRCEWHYSYCIVHLRASYYCNARITPC
jgi:hypothetical protein